MRVDLPSYFFSISFRLLKNSNETKGLKTASKIPGKLD
jgi:hypothetical protein